MLIRDTQEYKDLLEIRKYLLESDFMLHDEGGDFDGRVVSGIQERDVLQSIQEKFDIDVPPSKKGVGMILDTMIPIPISK